MTGTMELTQLPHDILVMMMRYLDVRDVLACRLVCKRLGDLALHRDTWRRRYHNGHTGCACPVLRLAPCIGVLQAWFPSSAVTALAEVPAMPGVPRVPPPCADAYRTTQCAAAELRLAGMENTGALQAEWLIGRQRQLGRLRRIILSVLHGEPTYVSPLLETLLEATSGLESLNVTILGTPSGDDVRCSTPLTPSLKFFDCRFDPEATPFVDAVLAAHAATLRTVVISPVPQRGTRMSPLTAPLLAGMPHLAELQCDCLPGLAVVATCESLRVLRLVIRTDRERRAAAAELVAEAAELLRRAEHLRSVNLAYRSESSGAATDVGADLVLALASSGRSRAERLSVTESTEIVEYTLPRRAPQLQPTLRALPQLPALQHLYVGLVDVDEVLLAVISPAAAPALRTVGMTMRSEVCAHAWLHGDTVKAVAAANPALHVKLRVGRAYCRRDSCAAACALLCHDEVLRDCPKSDYGRRCLGLFAHDPAADECAQEHTAAYRWIRVPL